MSVSAAGVSSGTGVSSAGVSGAGVAGGFSGGTAALGWSAAALADGQTLTITTDGTYNFGTKANAKPMYYWDAGRDNSLNSHALSRNAFTMTTPLGGLVTDVTPTNAVASLKYDYAYTGTGKVLWKNSANDGYFNTSADGAGDEIFCMYRRKYSFTAAQAYAQNAAWNHKKLRWWTAPVGSAQNIVIGCADNTDQGNPRITAELTGATKYSATTTSNDGWFGINTDWVIEAHWIQTGSVDVADAEFNWMCNGELFTWTFMCRTSAYPTKYSELAMPQAQSIANNQGWLAWCDFIYIDDTPHCVLISDAPTWNTTGAYRYEPFIPTAWSNTSITCSIRQGAFNSLTGKFLYIVGSGATPVNTTGLAL